MRKKVLVAVLVVAALVAARVAGSGTIQETRQGDQCVVNGIGYADFTPTDAQLGDACEAGPSK